MLIRGNTVFGEILDLIYDIIYTINKEIDSSSRQLEEINEVLLKIESLISKNFKSVNLSSRSDPQSNYKIFKA